MRILIIEDNQVNLELATDLLEVAGYEVLSACSAEDGVELARAQQPDLVLMDLSLPGMDGLTATRLLRADNQTMQIPIVVLTANVMKGDEARAREAGANGFIAKPIDTRAFARQIGAYLKVGDAA
jgi:CheY-like chemotaxis protein